MITKISLISKKYKLIICLEANQKFMALDISHTYDAIKFAKIINNRYFKVNLDLGTIISNNEDLNDLIKII